MPDTISGPLSKFPPGLQVYSWGFIHPTAGKCGGSDSDEWSTDRAIMESRMKFCPYECFIIEKVTGESDDK